MPRNAISARSLDCVLPTSKSASQRLNGLPSARGSRGVSKFTISTIPQMLLTVPMAIFHLLGMLQIEAAPRVECSLLIAAPLSNSRFPSVAVFSLHQIRRRLLAQYLPGLRVKLQRPIRAKGDVAKMTELRAFLSLFNFRP